MARAKRTDRAAARRRNRVSLEETPLENDLLEADAAADPRTTTGPTRRATAGTGATATGDRPPRPSITAAFRSAFRPVDLRGDLAALPRLVRHWSFFVPVLLSGLAVALVPLVGLNPLTSAFYQYFSFTAPLGTSFLAGFFAPRASYLVGILAALASVAFQVIAYTAGPFGGLFVNFRDASGAILTEAAAKELVINQALTVGVPSAALFAAAAAWYRRFLNRANPARQRPPAATGRRPDGRQPKKREQRPILARRR